MIIWYTFGLKPFCFSNVMYEGWSVGSINPTTNWYWDRYHFPGRHAWTRSRKLLVILWSLPSMYGYILLFIYIGWIFRATSKKYTIHVGRYGTKGLCLIWCCFLYMCQKSKNIVPGDGPLLSPTGSWRSLKFPIERGHVFKKSPQKNSQSQRIAKRCFL